MMVPMPCSCKDALQQNEVTNIFEDDFAALGDEEASSGSRRENSITEYQSFVDLTFSKNKVVSAIQWLPHRKVSRRPGSWCTLARMGHCSLWLSLRDVPAERLALAPACCHMQGQCTVDTAGAACEQLLPVQLALRLQNGCGLTGGHHLSSHGK